jgi:hypothetical protein
MVGTHSALGTPFMLMVRTCAQLRLRKHRAHVLEWPRATANGIAARGKGDYRNVFGQDAGERLGRQSLPFQISTDLREALGP